MLSERAHHCWKLGQGTHEDWFVCILASELLEVHHKAAVSTDASDLFLVHEPLNSEDKVNFDFCGHLI